MERTTLIYFRIDAGCLQEVELVLMFFICGLHEDVGSHSWPSSDADLSNLLASLFLKIECLVKLAKPSC